MTDAPESIPTEPVTTVEKVVKPHRFKKAHEALARKRAAASLVKTQEILDMLKKRQEEAEEVLKVEDKPSETVVESSPEKVIEEKPIEVDTNVPNPEEIVGQEKKTIEPVKMSTEEDIEIKPVRKVVKEHSRKIKKLEKSRKRSRREAMRQLVSSTSEEDESAEEEKPKKKRQRQI